MDFSSSKWIWVAARSEDDGSVKVSNTKKCDRVIFRKTFKLEKAPKSATVYAYARDSYNLYVNGKPVALGIKTCAGYDIAKYLIKGDNVIGFDCVYYGKPANAYAPPETSGLIVSCPELNLYSNKEFTSFRPYSQDAGEPQISGRSAEFNSYTDASRDELGEVFSQTYGSTLFEPSAEFADGGELGEGARINNGFDGIIKVKKMTKTTEGTSSTYVYDVAEEKIFYPVIEVTAKGTERVEIKSNRFETHDAWGKNGKCYGARGIYVCKNGTQKYVSPIPFCGSAIVITAPDSVSIKTVDLYTVSYPFKRTLSVTCDPAVQKLIDKCDNTMRACMDGGIMDNSDRDRGTDLFALSAYVRSALVTYNESVIPAVLYSIERAAGGETFCNNAGSPFAEENPVASLMFCSQLGAVASYYYRTADGEIIRKLRPKTVEYLLKWEFEENKLVPRGDGCVDAGYNTDNELVQTCLYYSAAKFVAETESLADTDERVEELNNRKHAIEENFAAQYYKNGYFSSGDVCDERANALAVIVGLAGDKAPLLKDALRSCRNASPAYESFVIEALGLIGEREETLSRILSRYDDFLKSDSTVLPEYFFGEGSACSSLAVSFVAAYVYGTVGFKYAAPQKPQLVLKNTGEDWRVEIPAGIGTFTAACKKGTVSAENTTDLEFGIVNGGETVVVGKGKTKIQTK